MINLNALFLVCLLVVLILILAISLPHRLGYFLANRLKKPFWAIAIYNSMIKLNYTAGSAYINRGQAYIVLRDYQQALQDTERGLELRPQSAIGYANRGIIHMHLKEYHQTVQDCSKAIELKPLLQAAYLNRCFAYLKLKEFRLARQDCEHILSVQPSNFRALALMVICCVYLGQYERAIECSNAALALRPDDANCYHNRGSAYMGMHNLAQAKADYLRSQELDPQGIDHGLVLEWYRLGFEQPDEAMPERLETLATFKVHDIQQHTPYLCRGIACWLRGHYEQGLVEFEQGLLLEPQDEEFYFWVGMACASLGREQEAQDALKHALQLGLLPFLLAPLKLLQTQQPDFYARYAQPLLIETGQHSNLLSIE